MNALRRQMWRGSLAALVIGTIAAVSASSAQQSSSASHARPVLAAELPDIPGKTITAVEVDLAPGEKSPRHRHAGSVLAFVLSGEIRSQNSATGPSRIYRAGEAFFEPPGSSHLISENVSDEKPARLLAVFVADSGARLTTPEKEEKP